MPAGFPLSVDAFRRAVSGQLNPGGALTLDQNLAGEHARHQRQVAAAKRRFEIGGRRRRAPSVADCVLALGEAFGVARAVVLDDAIAGRLAGLEPGVIDRIGDARPFDADRPIAAAQAGRAVDPGLGAFEVRQHVRVGPAERALLRPAVVVALIAARIPGDVDRGRAAQHLAAHGLDPAAAETGLRLRVIAPVVQGVLVHHAHAERNMDQRIDVPTAGFQEQYAHARIRAQPVCQDAAGRAGADNDVVVTLRGHSSPGAVATLTQGIWKISGRAIKRVLRTAAISLGSCEEVDAILHPDLNRPQQSWRSVPRWPTVS